MANYFVTGVSGALAGRVIPQLGALTETSKIVGTDRRRLSISAPKLQYLHQELDECDFPVLLQDVDVILHFATTTSIPSLRRLLDEAAKQGVKQFVMASSATVFGAWPTNPVPLPEDSPLRPNTGFDYAVRLAEAERVVNEWQSENPGIQVSILRMAMILGGGLDRALTKALGGVYTFREVDNSRAVQFLHIDDAASAIMLVIEKGLSGTFNVAPKGFIDDDAARAVAGTVPQPGLPKKVAWIANDLLFRKRYRSSFRAAEPYLRHPWVMSSDRLQAAGWSPAYTSEEALVAEAKPTWWAGLRPGQRRTIVTGGIVGGTTASVFGAIGGAILLGRKARK